MIKKFIVNDKQSKVWFGRERVKLIIDIRLLFFRNFFMIIISISKHFITCHLCSQLLDESRMYSISKQFIQKVKRRKKRRKIKTQIPRLTSRARSISSTSCLITISMPSPHRVPRLFRSKSTASQLGILSTCHWSIIYRICLTWWNIH